MSNLFTISINPLELGNRFAKSEEDPEYDREDEIVDEDEATNTPDSAFAECVADGSYESRLEPLLDRIPAKEGDLLRLYYIHRKRQADLAQIYGCTQAAISYRLERGIERLKFLASIPQIPEEELRAVFSEIFPQQIDVDILTNMWLITCQSAVAAKLKLTQGRVRHRFFRSAAILEEAAAKNAKYIPYQKVISALQNHRWNILREISLPQWGGRGGDCLT